jgi:hypothetical protein
VPNPVDDAENFADKWNEYPERRQAFMERVVKVRRDFTLAEEKATLNESVNVLSPLLGKRTMTKAAQELGLSASSSSSALAGGQIRVPELGDTSHCARPGWPENKLYNASIRGTVHFEKGGRLLWPIALMPVSRPLWLRFKVKTNTPPPYKAHWQVVNTGREAQLAGDLRGTFFADPDGSDDTHWEATKYSGTHWIEAFIIKNGICVARSGRKEVKIR